MAFVEVIRRSMRPEEYTNLRASWLKRYIYKEKFEVRDIQIQDARQVSENSYDYYPGGFRPLKKGDICFTPDGTAFFEAKVEIPFQLRGKELWLSMFTAAEIMVKVNGKHVGGFDPNRDRMLLNPYITADQLTIEMEGYNRSKPDDERNLDSMHLRGCRQEFNGLYLSTIRHEVLDLFYDLQILLDIANSRYFNEDYRKFLHRELNKALNCIDFERWREPMDMMTELLSLSSEEEREFIEQNLEASRYIQRIIYENDDFRGTGNLAIVGHSHLDIAYYWRRIHAVQKNARTVLIQMRLMDQYPEFKYTHTQPYTYELLETYYPELFEELKLKIKSGNFEPVGAMYVEPDCNVPSAESLVRQCLYGQLYYKEKFGITVNNCWLPDVFGNSWILPQIMKKSGVDYFVSNKMSTWNDTNRFPHNNFIWKGIDGSKVYACVPPTHFITWNMPSQIQENWEAYQDKETGGQTLSMFGYGDGGSGATEEMLEMMKRYDKLSIMPKTEHMGGAEFLEKNLKDNHELEVWDGELYLEMHRGTFTTKSELKRANRQLEFELREVEIASVLRNLSGEAYEKGFIKDVYKKFLINQFHDILPGSHIHPVYEDAIKDNSDVKEVLDNYLGSGELYFNSLNFERNEITFVEKVEGSIKRCGRVGEFVMPEMAPFSMVEELKPLTSVTNWLQQINNHIETPFYAIHFEENGSITSLYDKELDREWVEGKFNYLHIYQDLPGMYDAWDILPNYKEKELELITATPFHLVSADEKLATFETVLSTGNSTWKLVTRLFASARNIEVESIVDWHEKHKLAKMEFGVNVLTRELVCDTSAGFISRETHRNTTWQQARFEVCSHKWCDMSETDGGIAFINDGKYGVGIDGNHITLSLLRSNIRPDISSDIGHHEFCYQIIPHAGDHIEARINKKALEYNIPLLKPNLPTAINNKSLALFKALKSLSEGLFLQALKMSEDGDYVIARISEQDGRRGRIRMEMPFFLMNLLEEIESIEITEYEYTPFEIMTLAFKL